jgi:hypothetical protein
MSGPKSSASDGLGVSMEPIERYLFNLQRTPLDFLYSVSREFVRNCQTAMLLLPDDTPAHAYQTAVNIASLAPNVGITVSPGRAVSTHDSGPLEGTRGSPAGCLELTFVADPTCS